VARVAGAILVVIAMFVIGPIALFAAGAIWSALFGWMLSDEAEGTHAETA